MDPDRSHDAFIVFAREPRLGEVKQRLAAELGDRRALQIYERLLDRSLRLAGSWLRDSDRPTPARRLIIAAAGATSQGRLMQFCRHSGASLIHQPAGDLGERMRWAIDSALADGASRVVLAGCDCPYLTLDDRRQAFTMLESSQIVLAPTEDGGYCLIGMRSSHPQLFESIDWGSEQVHQQTLARASALRIAHLPLQADIDHLSDWHRWCESRAGQGLAESWSA